MTFRTRLARLNTSLRMWSTHDATSGLLMLGAAAVALAWANSPWGETYQGISDYDLGPAFLGLRLSLAAWATEGVLAIFFFTVGAELVHEIFAGSLRQPQEAAVPVCAALGGMIVPAALFTVTVAALGDRQALHGWAIPTATDIAFAFTVLAVFGRGLPRALRMFLLTLAVVDDLLGILVIAVFYTSQITWWALLATAATVAAFGLYARARHPRWFVLLPLGVLAWMCMHASGVHATIAGVALGFALPTTPRAGEEESRALRYRHQVEPLSALFALPVFAFFSAGISLGQDGDIWATLAQPVVYATVLGLVVGKVVGVMGTTAILTHVTPLRLPHGIGMHDLLPIGFLTGIGFTVSLLITELSFPDSVHTEGAKVAVLAGSVLSAIIAAGILRHRTQRTRDGSHPRNPGTIENNPGKDVQ